MRNAKLLLLSVMCFGLLGFAVKSASARPQSPGAKVSVQVQPQAELAGQIKTPNQAELGSFKEFLANHPAVAADLHASPAMVGNAAYLKRHTDLRQFLAAHPEIKANPEAFLSPEGAGGVPSREEMLKFIAAHPEFRRVEFYPNGYRAVPFQRHVGESVLIPLGGELVAIVFILAIPLLIVWILRAVFINRRWNNAAKIQAESHAKLLDKLSSSADVVAYMQSEPGKHFLEAVPLPVDAGGRPRLTGPLGRILWSLEVGLVVTLAGIGLLIIRNHVSVGHEGLLVFGTLALTVGLGFILSAGISFFLSKRMGLIQPPPAPDVSATTGGSVQ